jgi:5-methylcytosine-specific restriction protein A
MPEEINQPELYYEGSTTKISVNAYERNGEARKKCVEHHGCTCCICGFDFKKIYGEIGEGFIHVHHLSPLSRIKLEYKVDPITDMRPLCPNCHAVIHRSSPPFTIEQVKMMLKKA